MTTWRVTYKLDGKSLEAARALKQFAQKYAEAHQESPQGKSYLAMAEMSRRQNKAMLDELQKTQPDIVAATGLGQGGLQVWADPDGAAPRAYLSWPHAFYEGLTNQFFMFVPIDYRGKNFVPEDGLLLDDAEAVSAGKLLFGEDFDPSTPILTRPDYGVALPQDYDPAASVTFHRSKVDLGRPGAHAFRPQGESLAALNDFTARSAARDRLLNALTDEVKAIMPETLDLPAKAGLKVYTNVNVLDGRWGEPLVWVSVRLHGSGTPVDVPKNGRNYVVQETKGCHEARIVPNPETEEGRRFEKLLIKPALFRPDLHEYPALVLPPGAPDDTGCTPGNVPLLLDYAGAPYLVYEAGADIGAHKPQDAVPVSPAAFRWLELDELDRLRGVSPPPVPAALASELIVPAATVKPVPPCFVPPQP